MITDITNYIVEQILTWPNVSGTCPITEDPKIEYDTGIHLAYKHPIKGVLTKMTDESQYTGIDDRRGNFFYIRHVEDEQLPYNPPDRLIASCLRAVDIAVPLRLVSIIQGIEQPTGNERYSIEEFLRNALLNIEFTNYIGIEKNIEIELTLGRVNSPQVLAEERVEGAEPRGFGLDNVFVALDFLLKYKFNVETKGMSADVSESVSVLPDTSSPLNLVTSCDCEFWYDGQDADTFTLNGANVVQWDDKSGFGRHVLNAIDARRPSYNAVTGRVTFSNANETFLQSAAFGAALSQPNTVFVVYKYTGALDESTRIFDGTTINHQLFTSASFFGVYAGVLFNAIATNANNNIHVVLFNGVSSEYWINGASVATGDPGSNVLDGITIGAHSNLSFNVDAEIMEVFGYNCIITTEERVALENYLTSKWSL